MKDKILKLKEKCYACEACPLGRQNGLDPHVFASGKLSSKIMFIGEAPGADEQRMKKPFVGREGKFWESKVLEVAGLNRRNVYITNSVKCRPKGNRTPLPAEIEICRQYLDEEIRILRPKLLIPMGNIPLQSCCDILGITKHRGKLRMSRVWSDGSQVLVFPITHPAFGLRGAGLKETYIDAKNIGVLYRALENEQNIDLDFLNEEDNEETGIY